MSQELRKRHQNHAKEAAITAKRLADFLASAQAHEAILTQRLHDLEARDVFAHMGGYHMQVPGQTQEETESVAAFPTAPQQHESGGALMADGQAEGEDDDDLEGLEEYGEYR